MKKKISLFLFLSITFLLSSSILSSSIFANDTYVGVHIYIRATRNAAGTGSGTSHSRFIIDFEDLVLELKDRGINTIIFSTNMMAYHYQCDTGLAALSYPDSGGFTAAEVNDLAEIARNNNMKVVVEIETITHMEYNAAMGSAYPQYMVNEGAWQTGIAYHGRSDFVENNGTIYNCITSYVSSSVNEPGVGANWQDYWKVVDSRATRNPWNADGEELMFDMIDELINAFTAYNQEPDAFHIGGDEGYSWLKVDLNDSRNTENLDYAETYAMVMNNLYTHINTYHPDMDVMMWGDMLDPITNGNLYQTSDAIDDINTRVCSHY